MQDFLSEYRKMKNRIANQEPLEDSRNGDVVGRSYTGERSSRVFYFKHGGGSYGNRKDRH